MSLVPALFGTGSLTLHATGGRSAVDGMGGAAGITYPALLVRESGMRSSDLYRTLAQGRSTLRQAHEQTHRPFFPDRICPGRRSGEKVSGRDGKLCQS